ncbi:MAG: 4-(cytidine 5'-diphospho)-2-C-methyl-D-erythritol kinase [Acidimicrobiales bacterium]
MAVVPAVLDAPAKLTVELRVVGVRADGYHLLDAEMVTIDLCDTLHLTAGEGVEVVDEIVGAAAGGAAALAAGGGHENIVSRALALAGRRARVRIHKRIPVGGGLGGGSADAAAILRWAGRGDDVALAARLGADVPFCLSGGRARVGGVGEAITPLAPLARTFTLLTPPFGCSTVEVYRAWDRLGGPTGEGRNDLEAAALAVEPRLAEWRDRLAAATGKAPSLAGSGATWFVDGAHPGEGRVVVRTTA